MAVSYTHLDVYKRQGKANGNNKDKNEQKKLENAGITKNKFVKWA